MDKRYEQLSDEVKPLLKQLSQLKDELNQFTKQQYNRQNPFYENLIDWQEKGLEISGNRGTTVYESSTIIGDVKIGDGCWIGPFTMVDGSGGLTIGRCVTISSGAMIYSHDTLKYTLSDGKVPYEHKSVVIEDNCFIGTQAIILKGSHIGAHSLVAANSVVSGNIPPYSIVGGSPAKVIGEVVITDDDVKLIYHK